MPDSPATPRAPDNIFAGLGGFGAQFLDEAELRERIGAWYASFEGLRSSGPTERDYEAHVFPRDRAAWAHLAADTMFSCALHLRALMIAMRVQHRLLDVAYQQRVGFAVSDVATVARSFGALVEGPALNAYEPQAGDASCAQGAHGPHVSCFTSAVWEPGARLVLTSVDGGQGRTGDMAIEKNVYLLDRRAAGPALRSVESPAHSLDKPGPPAPVLWFVDLWKLALEAGLMKALCAYPSLPSPSRSVWPPAPSRPAPTPGPTRTPPAPRAPPRPGRAARPRRAPAGQQAPTRAAQAATPPAGRAAPPRAATPSAPRHPRPGRSPTSRSRRRSATSPPASPRRAGAPPRAGSSCATSPARPS